MKKFFCTGHVQLKVAHVLGKWKPCCLYTCISIYGWYKESLQQEWFCKSFLRRSINRLVSLSSSCAAPPFHFIKQRQTAKSEVFCVTTAASYSCFYVFNLLLHFQKLFLHIFHAYFFLFTLFIWKIIHFYSLAPFVWPDSRVILDRVRRRDERGACVGRRHASVPTYSSPSSHFFVLAPLWWPS